MNHIKRCLFFAFIAFNLFIGVSLAEERRVLTDVPDWLTGTLCFNSYGDRGESKAVRDQYLYFCDFDRRMITSIEIPGTGTISKELRSGRLLVIWNQPFSWGDEWTYQSPRWGMYRIESLERSKDGLEYRGVDTHNPFGSNIHGATHDGALALLGVRDTDIVYVPFAGENFYLCYAATEGGEMEIQMLSVQGRDVRVYHHFPLDYRWQEWEYCISNSGKIAWFDGAYSQRIYISDGETEVCLLSEDTMDVKPLGWLDDTTLLYSSWKSSESGAGVTRLMVYNMKEQAYSPFTWGSKKEANLSDRIYYAAALEDERGYLAYYRPYYERIVVKSLVTGEEYVFNPWPLVTSEEDEAYHYGYTDDDIRITEPNELIVPNLVWLPMR